MTIEGRRPRTTRRLFGDRELIEILEARELLTHLSGASVTGVQPSVLTPTITAHVSTVGTSATTATVSEAHAGSVPDAPAATVYGALLNPAFPMVTEAHAISRHGRLTALVVSFSHDMASESARDLANYEVTETSKGLPNSAVAIPLSAATYDPVHRAVTLTPAQPTPVGHFRIEGPGSQGKTTLTDVNGVAIDSGGGGPTPNAELFAVVKPHGHWFSPAEAGEIARRTIASSARHSRPSLADEANLDAHIALGAIISPFVRH